MTARPWTRGLVALACMAALTSLSPDALAKTEATEAIVMEVNHLLDEGLYAQALARVEAVLGQASDEPDDEWGLELLTLKAIAMSEMGQQDAALPLKERLVTLYLQRYGMEDAGTLVVMNNLATGYQNLDRFDEALGVLRRLQQMVAQRSQPLVPEQGVTMATNLAAALGQAGYLGEAIVQAQAAVTLAQQQLPPQHLRRLVTERNLAQMLVNGGMTAEGLPLAQSLVARFDRALTPSHPESAMAWVVLGHGLRHDGQFAQAEAAFDHASQVLEASLGPDHRLTLSARLYQARCRWEQGHDGQMLPDVERLLTQIQTHQSPDSVTALAAQLLLADMHLSQGRPARAQTLFEQVAQQWTRLAGPGGVDTLWARLGQARAQAAQGHREEALRTLAAATPQLEAQRLATGASAGPAAQRNFFELVSGVYGLRSTLQRDVGQTEASLGTLEQARARGLLDWLALRDGLAEQAVAPELRQTWQRSLERVAALDARIGRQATSPQAEHWRAERRQLESTLAELGRTLRQAEGLVDDGAEWRHATGDTSLVFQQQPDGRPQAYLRSADGQVKSTRLAAAPHLPWTLEAFRVWSASGPEARQWPDEQGRARRMYAVQADGEAFWLLSEARQPCDAAAWARHQHALRQQAEHTWLNHPRLDEAPALNCLPPGSRPVQGAAAYQALARQLGQHLLAPLHGQALQAGQTLAIVPDGPLWAIPWDALIWQGRPLVQQADVHLVPSLGVAARLHSRLLQAAAQSGPGRLLALGDVVYGGRPPVGAADGHRSAFKPGRYRGETGGEATLPTLPRLPYSRLEVERAGQVFGSPRSELWLGAAASERHLREWSRQGKLQDYDVVLMAAHGWFDPRWPELSAVVLGRDGPEDEQDGVLTASDWLGLQLKARVLILSACHSGRGALSRSEGLVGLSYAAMVAGASSTVQTLWQIQDASTALFVTRFLTHHQQGLPPVAALARTKREFQSSPNPRLANPRVWAAFGLHGV